MLETDTSRLVAEFAAREPAIPGLATLLDPERFLDALRTALPAADVTSAEILYVKYKFATSCLVDYRLEVAGAPVSAHAKAYGPSAANKLAAARGRFSVPGPLGAGRFTLENVGIVVTIFPNDAQVRGLRRLFSEQGHEMLRRLLPGGPALWGGELERLAYKPERRCVAKLSVAGEPRAAIKVYTKPGYVEALRCAEAFENRPAPRLLGRLNRRAILAFEWVPGRVLGEALRAPDLDLSQLVAVGSSLAELHTRPAEGLKTLGQPQVADALLGDATALGRIQPVLSSRALALATSINAQMEKAPPIQRPTHGDFHPRQVILAEAGPVILDLDRAVLSDPLTDVTGFAAHLQREVVRGKLAPERADLLEEALLQGYADVFPSIRDTEIGPHVAAAMLRLAPEFFRYYESDWSGRTEAMLERSEVAMSRAARSAPRRVGVRQSASPAALEAAPAREPVRPTAGHSPRISLPRAWPQDRARRVAYVLKTYPKFSETFIVNEILAHEAAGLEIEIFALRRPSDQHFQDSIARVRAPVHYLTANHLRAFELWSALRNVGRDHPDIGGALATAWGESAQEVYQAALLADAANDKDIDHLHAHFATSATTVARLAGRLVGLPYTFTTHAKDIFHEDVDPDAYRRKLDDAAAVVTVSDYNVSYLRAQYGAAAAKVSRIYNGIHLDRFSYETPQQRRPLIVAVGRLTEKKGFGYLVDACRILAQRGRTFECRIIGAGELEAALAEKIEKIGLGGSQDPGGCARISLTGPRPQDEVIEEIRAAAVLAAPCVVGADGNRDGLPTVLLESMALGTPCVATDVTGIPEVLRDGETGLIAPQHDADSLAAAIERLLDDDAERVRLALAARRLIEEAFDIHRNAARLRDVFAAGRSARKLPDAEPK